MISEPELSPKAVPVSSPRFLRVLLIEEDAMVRSNIREFFRQIPDIVTDLSDACTLTEGISCVMAHVYDLILLDLTLPNGRGVAAVQRLIDMRPSPPIILIGAPTEEDEHRCLAIGAQSVLPKEFMTASSLRRTILRTLARWSGTRRLIVERARAIAGFRLEGE